MKDIMIDCHAAALPQIDARRRPGLKLEIVGFDFILDEDLRVWLIEVNTCPFMGPVLTQ
jgi:glutathione synthase/RimK-type ligase-like ATP-grasp enzyme